MAKQTSPAHYQGKPLSVTVKDGQLVIAIGVNVLAHAVAFSEWANPWREDIQDYRRSFAILSASEFAMDIKRQMLKEREDGSSLLTDFLDKATEAAVDDGSEACDYEDVSLPSGKFARMETWSKR